MENLKGKRRKIDENEKKSRNTETRYKKRKACGISEGFVCKLKKVKRKEERGKKRFGEACREMASVLSHVGAEAAVVGV